MDSIDSEKELFRHASLHWQITSLRLFHPPSQHPIPISLSLSTRFCTVNKGLIQGDASIRDTSPCRTLIVHPYVYIPGFYETGENALDRGGEKEAPDISEEAINYSRGCGSFEFLGISSGGKPRFVHRFPLPRAKN